MSLTNQQRKELKDALNDAFPAKPKLEQFVSLELNKNLNVIAMGDDLSEIVFKLISTAESQGWETELIFAARNSNPRNAKLSAFVRVYESEYWKQLEKKAYFYEPLEADASHAIVETVPVVEKVISTYKANYPTELMYLLQEILDKLNEPGQPATAKAKLALSLIPGILSYEVEVDTENTFRRAFQPIKQLFDKTVDSGK